MQCIGTIRVTRAGDRLPTGFVLTSARVDLLICLSIPFYTCIIGWDKLRDGTYKPIKQHAIREQDVKRVNDVIMYDRQVIRTRAKVRKC